MNTRTLACLLTLAAVAVAPTGSAIAQKNGKRQKIVMVVNGRGKPLQRLYASNVSRRSWEEDILGDATIASKGSMKINFDDGSDNCIVDVKAAWSDEVVVSKRNVDVCATKRLVLSAD